jgi:predicted O-methyltransferase YrrM
MDVPVSPLTGVPGWHNSDSEELFYAALSRQVAKDGCCIVEVGCEYGRGTAAFLHGLRGYADVYYHCVDLFPDLLRYQHAYCLSRFIGKTGLDAAGLRIIYHQGDSAEIGRAFAGRFDLLLIDADHNYAKVKEDIASWLPHAAGKAIVVFHDCAPSTNPRPHMLHLQVQQAVDEWYADAQNEGWQELPPVYSTRAFQRGLS